MTDIHSILDGATPDDVAADPFAHLLRTDCLDGALFRALSETMPPPQIPAGTPQNFLALLDPFAPQVDARLTDAWRRFAAHHTSPAFFQEIVRVLGPAIRRTHPGLEARLGQPLETAPSVRAGDPTDGPTGAPIRLGLQFGFNTPVTTPSSVRGAHIDKARRLISALLYLPEPGDDAGGDLMLYRYRSSRRLRGVSVALEDTVPVARIAYAPNTLILFVNSLDAVHGVLPRRPTGRVRRYVNFFVDLAEDFIDGAPYQVASVEAR